DSGTTTAGSGFALGNNYAGLFADEYVLSSSGALNPTFTFSAGSGSSNVGACAAFAKGGGSFSLVGNDTHNNTAATSVVLSPSSPPGGTDLLIVTVTSFDWTTAP